MRIAIAALLVLCACGGSDAAPIAGDWSFTVGVGDLARAGSLKLPNSAGPYLDGTGTLGAEGFPIRAHLPSCSLVLRTSEGGITVIGDCSSTTWSGKATGAGFDGAIFAARRPGTTG